MSEKDYNNLLELAIELSNRTYTDEEALESLVRAGILDWNGKLTPPYECLAVPPKQ